MTDTGDPHPELYDAADAALLQLEGDTEVLRVVLRFEMTTLRLLGHLPGIARLCRLWSVPGSCRDGCYLGSWLAGLLCPTLSDGPATGCQCDGGSHGRPAAICLACDRQRWHECEMDARTRGEVRGIVSQYICNVLDHRPRMHQYLGSLAGGSGEITIADKDVPNAKATTSSGDSAGDRVGAAIPGCAASATRSADSADRLSQPPGTRVSRDVALASHEEPVDDEAEDPCR